PVPARESRSGCCRHGAWGAVDPPVTIPEAILDPPSPQMHSSLALCPLFPVSFSSLETPLLARGSFFFSLTMSLENKGFRAIFWILRPGRVRPQACLGTSGGTGSLNVYATAI